MIHILNRIQQLRPSFIGRWNALREIQSHAAGACLIEPRCDGVAMSPAPLLSRRC